MQISVAPEIHRWIRPASLKQRTVSFYVTPPAEAPIRDNADDGREGKDEQPLLPSITGGTLCASNGPL
jgi:hypothetical protein